MSHSPEGFSLLQELEGASARATKGVFEAALCTEVLSSLRYCPRQCVPHAVAVHFEGETNMTRPPSRRPPKTAVG